MTGSRPLRWLAGILALWTGARVALLWPDAASHQSPFIPTSIAGLAGSGPASSMTILLDPPVPLFDHLGSGSTQVAPTTRQPFTPAQFARPVRAAIDPNAILAEARGGSPLLAMLSLAGFQSGFTADAPAPTGGAMAPDPRAPSSPVARRLSGYGWLFVRDGGTPGLADGGQLGGSQAGLRLDYALVPGFALTGRLSAPIETRTGREAAIGFSWQPARDVPLSLTVERRVALDKGGRNAFTAMAAGGIGPVALPARFTLEAYGQAGIVGIRSRDGFVDGAATVMRPLAEGARSSAALGGGVWGAAQPGVSRLDIGPRLRFRLNAAGANIGASFDWRQRVAGNAAPRSALAITLDGGF